MKGRAARGLGVGQPARLYVRPEVLTPDGSAAAGSSDGSAGGSVANPRIAALPGGNAVSATVERIDFEGAFALLHGRLADGAPLTASLASTHLSAAPAVGAAARFTFPARHAVVLGEARA